MLEIISTLVYKSDIMREFVKSKKQIVKLLWWNVQFHEFFFGTYWFHFFLCFWTFNFATFKPQWNTDVELTAGAAVEMPN